MFSIIRDFKIFYQFFSYKVYYKRMVTQPLPWAACSNVDNPFGEEIFPNIKTKPPLVQLEAISSCPITCYLGEETDPHLSTTSFQREIRSSLSLLFSRLNNPSSLSRSSSDLCSRAFTSFVALLWTRSSTSMSLLYSGGRTTQAEDGTMKRKNIKSCLLSLNQMEDRHQNTTEEKEKK
ncbi:hypothetical protein QYF61_012958 [Mycteria americana]|uniref:Uncharacterized protein n=1 Tax=Mycteria americana TaxID=33587 RepID=A0AAN7N5K1_MYCAM|nr:hypothetical protein QYF61_012958 [Mycteria americana]